MKSRCSEIEEQRRPVWWPRWVVLWACVAGLTAFTQPASDPPSHDVKQVKARLKGPAIVFPDVESNSCQQARQRLPGWLAEMEAEVDPVIQAASKAFVEEQVATTTRWEAWDQLGVSILLKGDAKAALWCAFNALEIQWSGDVLTNAGICFINLDRSQDALILLNCAYAEGYRSANLFEAMANIHRQNGNQQQAIMCIELASAAEPEDVFIHVEKSLVQTGQPPADPQQNDDRRRFPELDQAMAQLEAHAARVTREIMQLAAELDRIEQDPESKQYRDALLDLDYESIASLVANAWGAVDRARISRDEFRQTVYDGPGGDQAYDKQVRMMYNQAIVTCIQNYSMITEQLLTTFSGRSVDDPGWHARFWGRVINMNPVLLEKDQKLRWDDAQAPDAISSDASAQWNWLDQGARIRFWSVFWPSDTKATEQARACPPGPDNKACQIRAYELHCERAGKAFDAYVDESESMYGRGANRFNHVASATILWGKYELTDFQQYAARWYKSLKLQPPQTAGFDEKTLYDQMLNEWWSHLRAIVVDPEDPTWGLTKYLQEEATWFVSNRSQAVEFQASLREQIEHSVPFGGCSAVHERYLEILAQEAWEEYLNELRENLAGDFDVGYHTHVNCDFKLGPLTFNIDESGKKTGTFNIKDGWSPGVNEKFKSSIKNGKFASASAGGGTSASGGVFSGSTDFNIFVEKNSRTGKMDGGVSMSGKLGLGLQVKKKIFGKDVGLGFACYPGSVDFKVHARAAFDDAVTLVMAQNNGPPQ